MSKITESAKGTYCQVRIAGVCNHNPETTVHAHLNGGGIGMKRRDVFGSRCCSACHDVVDGRAMSKYREDDVLLWFYEGVFRTQSMLIEEGVIDGYS